MYVCVYGQTTGRMCDTDTVSVCVCVCADKYGALSLSLSIRRLSSPAAGRGGTGGYCAERVANQKRNLILDAGYLHILLTQTAGTRGPENSA